jgi:glycosyltransferase involved in cell wall biosynthesis
MPRVILGSPLFNHAAHFREAIESVLNQTFTDFALVLVDDRSTDGTPQIAREYEALDSRVWFCQNDVRLGLIDNSRKALALARDRHPDAEYFAWVSDHDLWHPRWLQELVVALDANPEVVLAYPLNRRIGPSGEVLRRLPWRFDTIGLMSPWARLRVGIRHMRAGNMVYGLYRIGVLQRAGVYRKVVVPDRLLFAELSLYGQFKQVSQVLWFRRWYGRVFSLERQRASFFPSGRPLYAYVPWWLSHTASLFWTYAVRGDGLPNVSRPAGLGVAVLYLGCASFVHARQSVRGAVARVAERLGALRRRGRLILTRLLACVGRRWPRSGPQKDGLTGASAANRTDTSELLE